MIAPDPYSAGKELAALGRLALIADELGEKEAAATLRGRLATLLEGWFQGTWLGLGLGLGLGSGSGLGLGLG